MGTEELVRGPYAITVWPFYEAPLQLRSLSAHGGDEDWLALVPAAFDKKYGRPLWLEDGSSFGCCDVSRHVLADGDVVYIGAHA